MRISELHKPELIDKFRDEFKKDKSFRKGQSLDSLKQWLSDHGFVFKASGWFAQVFEHPKYPDQIFKIFHNDPTTIHWLNVCLKNKSNPYFPKIKSSPIKIVNDLFMVRMEKLEFKSEVIQNTFAIASSLSVQEYQEIDQFLSLSEEEFNKSTVVIRVYDSMGGMGSIPSETYNIFHKLWKDDNFISCVSQIYQLSGNGNNDLHSSNLMFRGNQLVIIDPLSS